MTQRIGIELIAIDENFVSGFDRAMKKLEDFNKQADGFNARMAEMAKDTESAAKSNMLLDTTLADTTQELKKETKAVEQAKQEQANYKSALSQTVGEIKVFGVSMNDVKGKLEGSISKLKDVRKALGTNVKGFKLLKVAMASTGIGLLVVVLGSLVAFMTRTQRGADAIAKAMAILGAATDVITDKFEEFGEKIFDAIKNPRKLLDEFFNFLGTVPQKILDNIIVRFKVLGIAASKLFSGDFSGAAKAASYAMTGVEDVVEKVSNATKSLTEEIIKETKAAKELTAAKQRLRDAEIDLAKKTAETRAEIKDLNKTAEDTTKTFDERKEAAKKAYELEQGLLKERIKLAEENVSVIQKENALSNNLTEDNERLAEAQIRLADIKAESLELQTTIQNKLNALTKEQQALVEQTRKQYEELSKSLSDSILDYESEQDPFIKILNTRQKAINELKSKEDQFKLLAPTLSDEEIKATEDGLKKLADLIDAETSRQTLELRGEIKIADIDSGLDRQIENIEIKTKATVSVETVEAKNFKEKIQGALDDISKSLGSEGFKVFQGLADNITSIFVDGINRQIDALDAASEKRKEQIEDLEDEIEQEKALKEKGFEFNVELKEKELEELRAKEEEDQKKKEELQEKQRKAQLINDIIQQSSSLATAAAEIFKSTAGIPFIGIGLAIAAVASMFAAFASARSKAKEATRLYTGADSIYEGVGEVAPGEASDVPGRGDGFDIVDGKGNVRGKLGGEEMLIDGSTTNSHGAAYKWIWKNKDKISSRRIIELLKDDVYGDIAAASDNLRVLSNESSERSKSQQRSDYKQGIKEAFSEALGDHAKDLISKYEHSKQKEGEEYEHNGNKYIKRMY